MVKKENARLGKKRRNTRFKKQVETPVDCMSLKNDSAEIGGYKVNVGISRLTQ